MVGQWVRWTRAFDSILAGCTTQETPGLARLYIEAGLAEAIDRPRGVRGGRSESFRVTTVERAPPHLRASAKVEREAPTPDPLPLLAGTPTLFPASIGDFPNVQIP